MQSKEPLLHLPAALGFTCFASNMYAIYTVVAHHNVLDLSILPKSSDGLKVAFLKMQNFSYFEIRHLWLSSHWAFAYCPANMLQVTSMPCLTWALTAYKVPFSLAICMAVSWK